MRYCILTNGQQTEFIALPGEYTDQFIALIRRLHKEIDKLTVEQPPILPVVLGEVDEIHWIENSPAIDGLAYIHQLEKQFANVQEENYPLISLLTEIRALQAQLEHLVEEGEYE